MSTRRHVGPRYPVRIRSLMIMICLAAVSGAAPATAQPAPDSSSVLILASLDPTGHYANQAATAGWTVVSTSDSDWSNRTTADFATFRALILPDPNCSGLSAIAVAEANAATWGAAVDGPVLVIGTDEFFHLNQGGNALIDDGIAFVTSGAPAETGAYISLSCYYDGSAVGTPVPLLAPFGSFLAGEAPGCFNDAHIVAVHPALSNSTDASLSNWSCSVHNVWNSFPSATFLPLAIAENVTGPGQMTFADGSTGIPYILARGAGISPILCGNGVVEPPEECDDGNTNDGDGCSSFCTEEVILPCLPPPPGMVFWAPLDETSGPTSADLAAGNDGTHVGSPTPVPGLVAGALDLGGGHVSVPGAPELDFGTGNFSIDFWISQADPLGTIVSKFDTVTQKGFEVYLDFFPCCGNPVFVNLQINYFTYTFTSFPIPPGAGWTQIALVIDRSNQMVHFYADGSLRDSMSLPLPMNESINNSEPLFLGKGVALPVDYEGILDEVEIFNRVLSATEVQDLYDFNDLGKCRDSVHVPWDRRFCQGAESVIADVEVCNYSTSAQTYELDFMPLAANGGACDIGGPTVFTDPVTGAPPPFSVTVQPQTCQKVPVRIDRPAGMNQDKLVACYQVKMTNLATLDTLTAAGSVQDRRSLCMTPDILVPRADSFVALPGTSFTVAFPIKNNTDAPFTLSYLVEAMPSSSPAQNPVVRLNDGEPGTPVSGEILLLPQVLENITIDVEYSDYDRFRFHDLVLSTLEDEPSAPLPFTSVSLRNPTVAEVVIANDDQGMTTSGTPLTLSAISNDFSLGLPLDPASVVPSSSPVNGTAIANGDGTLTYQSNPGFTGLDGFLYEVCTVSGDCAQAAIIISVNPLEKGGSIFTDGFESGDTSAWSSTVG